MATMCVESSLHGLRPPPAQPASGAAASAAWAAAAPGWAALAVQPGTGCLVVAGPHAVLQFYDALRCGETPDLIRVRVLVLLVILILRVILRREGLGRLVVAGPTLCCSSTTRPGAL